MQPSFVFLRGVCVTNGDHYELPYTSLWLPTFSNTAVSPSLDTLGVGRVEARRDADRVWLSWEARSRAGCGQAG